MTEKASERGDATAVVYRISSVAAVLAAIGTLFALFGDLFWVLELASALRVQYAILFTVLVMIFAVLRAWPMLGLSLLGALVNYAVIAPLYLTEPAPPDPDSAQLEIMFLNVEFIGADIDAMIEDLRSGEHDLVFLSATNDAWVDAFRSAPIPYSVVEARSPGVDLELLALAREGIRAQSALHDFGFGGRDRAVEVLVQLDSTPVRVLAMHPVSPITPGRAQRNSRQLERLASWAASQEEAVLIVGDLNNTPWSPRFATLTHSGNLVNSQGGFGVQASWPSWMGPLGIPIDHALHSEDLTTVERSLGPGYGSAHRSLRITVALSREG